MFVLYIGSLFEPVIFLNEILPDPAAKPYTTLYPSTGTSPVRALQSRPSPARLGLRPKFAHPPHYGIRLTNTPIKDARDLLEHFIPEANLTLKIEYSTVGMSSAVHEVRIPTTGCNS